MKKFVTSVLIIVMFFTVVGCGNTKWFDGVEYDTYGIFTLDEKANNIKYKVIVGNVVWSIILMETIVAPIYFLGFSLFEPVRKLNEKELGKDATF